MILDTVFIHADAQGGLIFLFMPIYQGLSIGLLELALAIVTRSADPGGGRR